ncbi:hypothetical protein AALC25_04260 [Lachnospiraceae bacterium 29-84]
MKKIAYLLIIAALLIYILAFPKESVQAAAFGLGLWYEKLLPTLLPVSILSYLLIHSGILDGLTRRMHRIVKHFFPVSSAGLYPLAAGLLFGFPMGSKITAELVLAGKMSKEEGERLCCACNNISPMFITSFLLGDCLKRPDLRIPTLFILYTPPLFLYMVKNRKRQFPSPLWEPEKKAASMNFQVIDAGIMNGFETLAKLGGYIMMFAILAQMATLLPMPHPILRCMLVGFTELTNGIAYTAGQGVGFAAAYPLMMAYTAFGGLSGLAQTASMVKEAGFSLAPYLTTKLLSAGISFALAALFLS